jgi:radical SAM superfamily enzyme YgiQ (UPF0313 family)
MPVPAGAGERPDLLLIDDEVLKGDHRPNFLAQGVRWLMDPPKIAVPLLSAYAKAAGHSVRTVCYPSLPWRENELDSLLAARPLVVGITTVAIFSPKYMARLTNWIREASPSSVIVLGGHGAQYSRAVRALGDVFISGHGEQVLADLVTHLKAGGKAADFPGASLRDGVVEIPGPVRYEGIRRVRFPDWTASSSGASMYPVEASRGCKFNCSYCDFPGRGGQAYRDPAEVVEELETVHRQKGVRSFEFVDSSLTGDEDLTARICAAIRAKGLRIKWKCFARPDSFVRAPGLAGEMAASGCFKMFMGIESIHDPILSMMRRGMKRADIATGLDRVFKAGIKVHANFIIGLPGETAATIRETADFVIARPFSSVYFGILMVSEDLRARAAAEPERFLHLERVPGGGWRHDTMDYERAKSLSFRAIWRINLRKLWPLAMSLAQPDPDQ